jgi:hypothetical protein
VAGGGQVHPALATHSQLTVSVSRDGDQRVGHVQAEPITGQPAKDPCHGLIGDPATPVH